jgi:predicted phage terminase large subunit-like protein
MIPGFDLSKIDPKLQLADIDRADCEDSLYEFYKAAWPYIDPAPWVDSWAIDAVAEHLQAVIDGEIRKLLINISPRSSKSGLVSVALLPWCWAQSNITPISGPGIPFLYASYANQLSLRDSVKCRRLIESGWYQARWGNRFQLTSDQNTKSRFTNDKGGERLITSVDGTTTGEGAQILVGDDLNAANEAFSEASIKATTDWWDSVASTRLNDPKTGAFIVIQQRLAEDDISGHILEKNSGEWCHLMIPMRYEPERSFITTIGWKDPRTVAGELMWPERFGEAEVVSLERALGPMIANGQLQQRPEPAGGGIIPRDYWKLWERDTFPAMDFVMASLDTAYTEKTSNDFSALTVWGVFSGERSLIDSPNRVIDRQGKSQPMFRDNEVYEAATAPKVMMMHAWQDRLELHKLVEKVADSCTKLKVDLLLIESKAAGYSVAQEVRRLYANERFGVQLFDPKSQDKLSRLFSIQHLFAEGIIFAPDRKWADMVITQVAQFPYSKHDDLTDTVSQALRHMRDNGLIARAPERAAELEELQRYRGRQEPLYPV